MRHLIIGDVHGMREELHKLLSLANVTKDDVIVSVGDLLDKGPESAGVVKLLRAMREHGYTVVLVEGNHEEKHARFRKALKHSPSGVKGITMKGVDEMAEITFAMSDDDIAFLETAVPYHRIVEHDVLVVHAGILPTMTALPSLEDVKTMPKGELEKFKRILRVRHVTGSPKTTVTVEFEFGHEVTDVEEALDDMSWTQFKTIKSVIRPKGDFIALGDEKPGKDPFWADVYDNRFGHVYFGHSPFPDKDKPVEYPHATALDLGAVFGGHLVAAVLEEGKKPEFIMVHARQKFASGYWEE